MLKGKGSFMETTDKIERLRDLFLDILRGKKVFQRRKQLLKLKIDKISGNE